MTSLSEPVTGSYPTTLSTGEATRSASLLPVALALALNGVTALGVVAFGWPAGNVFLLFWVENAVLGAWSVVRIATARGTGGRPVRLTVNDRWINPGPVGMALFFCVHYGVFCLVHAVFTGFVAHHLGIEATFLLLGLPIVLIMVRYAVETFTVWFGAGQRDVVSPSQAMTQPYPRIVVLHVAVLVAFSVILAQQADRLETLPGQESWLVLVLIVLKTVVDVWTTRRASRV